MAHNALLITPYWIDLCNPLEPKSHRFHAVASLIMPLIVILITLTIVILPANLVGLKRPRRSRDALRGHPRLGHAYVRMLPVPPATSGRR